MAVYIAEIAGKDSVAAVLRVMRQSYNSTIIPTIVYTRTEYGGFQSYFDSISFLKKEAERQDIVFGETQELSDEKLWNLCCVKYQNPLFEKYHFYSPCIMCHVFAHLIRIPVYKKYRAEGLITGERHSHGGVLKINQDSRTLACFGKILESVGVKAVRPLVDIEDTMVVNREIENESIIQHANDTKCILSGNMAGCQVSPDDLAGFLHSFLEPVGIYAARQILDGRTDFYEDLENLIKNALGISGRSVTEVIRGYV